MLKEGKLRQVETGPEIVLTQADDYVACFVRDAIRSRILSFGSLLYAADAPGEQDTPLRTVRIERNLKLEAAFRLLADSSGLAEAVVEGGRLVGIVAAKANLNALARPEMRRPNATRSCEA